MAKEEKEQANTQEAAPEPTTPTVPEQAKTETESKFTQADLERIIKERLDREREGAKKKYADYDVLKEAAARLKQIEDANKSETEKAAERANALEAQLSELQSQNARLAAEKTETLLRASIVTEATKVGFLDPMDAYRMLDLAELQIGDDGKVAGLDKALKALVEAKPYLVRAAPQLGPTNPGRPAAPGQETDAERRQRLYGIGASPFGRAKGGGSFVS